MKVLKNIIKFIILTVLTICMVAEGITVIVSSTILDKNYITEKLEETNFYEETYELVISEFENYIYQSGLDEEVLENICSEEKVEKDINTIISNIYAGTDTTIDTTEIEENLNANIEASGIKTSSNEEAIKQFVEQISNAYKEAILHTKYETQINEVLIKISDILEKINNIVTTIILVCIILIILINLKRISEAIREIGIALLATGIFNIISYTVIIKNVNITGIKIFNDTFSNTIITIIEDIIEDVLSLGIGALILALMLICFGITTKIIKESKEKSTVEETKTTKEK